MWCNNSNTLKNNLPILLAMANILWKNNTAGILVLTLLAAGTFTLLAIPNSKLVTAQSNNSNVALANTTSKGLTNPQTISTNNASREITPSPAETLSRSSVFAPFATSSGVSALQSNNIVNTRVAYDIIFRAASAGAIKTVEMTFPPGTSIRNATVLEVSGIGRGATSVNGQTLIYTVANPVNVPINVFLRFEVWNVVNPPTPNPNLAVHVTTKNSVGGEIDSGTSASYSIKQILTSDIANNAILGSKIRDGEIKSADIAGNTITSGNLADSAVTTSKIATDAVTADRIAGVSKLIFQSCDGNPTPIAPNQIIAVQCTVPGASLQDNILITTPFVCLGGDPNQNPPPSGRCLEILGGRVSNAGVVSIFIINDIMPLINVNTGPMKFSMIVFKP